MASVDTATYQPQTLLVTGGAGFIGCNFVHYWLENHPDNQLVVLDALTYAGNLASLEPLIGQDDFHFVHGDICDTELVERLLREHRVDTIVHFAAESHVDRSIHGPDEFIQTNIVGTHSLLKAAKIVWLDDPATATTAHRFHHVSTDEVYGSLDADGPAFTEDTPYAPNSPYSASKAASDHLVRAYHHTYGMNVVTSNCSNNYGPYQFPEKLIPLVIINILHGKPLPIYGDGMNIRDWLYVDDHARGIELCIQSGRAGETYNIGGNEERTNIDIVRTLCAKIDARFAANPGLAARFPDAPPAAGRPSDSLITYVQDRPGHDRRYAIDATKTKAELGYQPMENFDGGMEKTIDWYLANEPWWRAILSGEYTRWLEKHYA